MLHPATGANTSPHARQTPAALAEANDHKNHHNRDDHEHSVKLKHNPASIRIDYSRVKFLQHNYNSLLSFKWRRAKDLLKDLKLGDSPRLGNT